MSNLDLSFQKAMAAFKARGEFLVIMREPLDRQGYTKAGRYFGVGEKLWSYSIGGYDGFVRARDKKTARQEVVATSSAFALGPGMEPR